MKLWKDGFAILVLLIKDLKDETKMEILDEYGSWCSTCGSSRKTSKPCRYCDWNMTKVYFLQHWYYAGKFYLLRTVVKMFTFWEEAKPAFFFFHWRRWMYKNFLHNDVSTATILQVACEDTLTPPENSFTCLLMIGRNKDNNGNLWWN